MENDNALQFAIVIRLNCFPVPVCRPVGGVGAGLMGGKMVDYQALGKTAAELVVKIFSGTAVETIAMIEETPYYYIFDYHCSSTTRFPSS